MPELLEVKPTYLPSVPRVFEKIYTLAHGAIEAKPPEERQRAEQAIALGVKVRDMINRGEEVPEELQGAVRPGRRGAVQKRARHLRRQGAPRDQRRRADRQRDPRVLLGLRRARARGLRHDRDCYGGDGLHVENHRFGTVGRALPGVELKIADDGEILVKGPNIFHGYHNQASTTFGAIEDGWLHTGDLGAIDADGYLSITGRKKDIIITAGGKNLTPANVENDLKQCRWISQAVMHGDQRPYPVVLITLDEEEIPVLRARARPAGGRRRARAPPRGARADPAGGRPRQRKIRARSSRSRSSRSSTTTSPRRPAS